MHYIYLDPNQAKQEHNVRFCEFLSGLILNPIKIVILANIINDYDLKLRYCEKDDYSVTSKLKKLEIFFQICGLFKKPEL